MNLILFEPGEIDGTLAAGDPRARHLFEVLKLAPGEEFDAGVVNGPRGRAWIRETDGAGMRFGHRFSLEARPAPPVALVVGLSRPQTMRRVLRDCTSLGVREMLFAPTETGEASYASSGLWERGEYRRHLLDGAQQAATTSIPEVRLFPSLRLCLDALPASSARLALDNVEASIALASFGLLGPSSALVFLAVGSERGWTPSERELLRSRAFTLARLGSRILRTESACLSALTLVLARLGCLE